MIIFPAIDIKDQQCVRLIKGDFNQKDQYTISPLEAALKYQKEGATWLHVIDLDGAQTGQNQNIEVIKEIINQTDLNIQVGGGIRSKANIELLLSMGIDRVIVGTFAIDYFDVLQSLVKRYPSQIIVSLDSKNGFLTKQGWQRQTKIKTIDFARRLETIGIETIVVTDIDKDGMMMGPNFKQLELINSKTSLNIIASGGVSSINDVSKLYQLNLYGAIVGKALYLDKINLKEAILCSQEESYLA